MARQKRVGKKTQYLNRNFKGELEREGKTEFDEWVHEHFHKNKQKYVRYHRTQMTQGFKTG